MRHRPFVVRVTWPTRRWITLGFNSQERAEEYAEAVGKRGAIVQLRDDLTGELILETGERLQFQFIPREGFELPGGRPGAVPGLGAFTPGVADFPAEWVAADGRIVLGGFIRFTGATPGTAVTTTRISRATAIGGDITCNSVGAWAELAAAAGGPGTGGLDLTIAAATNDVLEFSYLCTFANSTAAFVLFDFVTRVGGASINWLGQANNGAANGGLVQAGSTEAGSEAGTVQYVVQAGDISGGNVTIRPFYRSSGSRVLARSQANGPLMIAVANLKQ